MVNWAAVYGKTQTPVASLQFQRAWLSVARTHRREPLQISDIVYLFVYTLMNMGAFGVIISLRRRGIIGDNVDDLTQWLQKAPLMAAMMTIFMLSLALPDDHRGRFIGKWFLFGGLIQRGGGQQKLVLACWLGHYQYGCVVLHLANHPGDVSWRSDGKP